MTIGPAADFCISLRQGDKVLTVRTLTYNKCCREFFKPKEPKHRGRPVLCATGASDFS